MITYKSQFYMLYMYLIEVLSEDFFTICVIQIHLMRPIQYKLDRHGHLKMNLTAPYLLEYI